ncbi:heme lyase subunit NrfE [Salmonella enterica subsp. enterica]|uniref:Cytochrome c-type biogenesis protein n=1 Tax=Salmonella enterica I TaxID=59201 RepID=A0A447MZN2_SALET|nr:heme lyase subunit NrfE [Salmonella enterica subsp. enterica]
MALRLSGLRVKSMGRPDKAFTPPSGKTMLLLALLIFLPFATHAQVVDTWTFANPQQQEKALSIASQLRCPQCQNQNFAGIQCAVAVSMRHQVLQHGCRR